MHGGEGGGRLHGGGGRVVHVCAGILEGILWLVNDTGLRKALEVIDGAPRLTYSNSCVWPHCFILYSLFYIGDVYTIVLLHVLLHVS